MKALPVLLALVAAPAAAQDAVREPVFMSTGAFIGISVHDLEATTRWYSESLGLSVIFEPPAHEGMRVVVLAGGGLTVELVHNAAAVPLRTAAPQITHTTLVHGIFKAGIAVDDLGRTLTMLRERGVPIVASHPTNFMIQDNEGNYLQFFAAGDPVGAPGQGMSPASDRRR